MYKQILTSIFACIVLMTASSQTLFTYGKYAVDAKDFLRAYNKNNTQPVVNKSKSIRDYLDLYVKSRLKIREAYERGYDTLPGIKMEVANLRAQIAENYMTDPEIADKMVKTAFQRSLKDVHVAHIFIAYKNNNGITDSAASIKKREDVINRLKKGDDFLLFAQQQSDDPAVKNNNGDIGYITVFSLPYVFENAIYSTPVGKYSAAIPSKMGYHIFKNLGERKAAGKIKAQQILLAIPPGSDDGEIKKLASRADSLYKRIIKGDDFGKLAAAFSNDYVSAVNSGTMPDIGVGQYDPAFEKVLWSLSKDGAVSKPFLTSYGWHILKRNAIKPVITDPNNKSNQQELMQKIKTDSRWKSSKDFIYNKVIEIAGYKKHPYNDAALWAMSDSLLDFKPLTDLGKTISSTTPLFTIGDSTYKAADWISYARTFRFKEDGTGAKPHQQVFDEYSKYEMQNYYKEHLEDFNSEFKSQMTEFKDGNLFFEIMQQEIWNKAQSDSVALLGLYNKNKTNYIWKQSAEAVIFFCADETSAKTMYVEVNKKPVDWRKAAEILSEKVIADSSRYEWSQIPNLNKIIPKAGMVTTPLVNTTDNTATFAYIIKVYNQPMQRNFTDAKGLVINDYQALLEKQWEESLRKKYPVVIDQKVLNAIAK
jgi:peptidyl-prolyl cis-trans isomerase SurA